MSEVINNWSRSGVRAEFWNFLWNGSESGVKIFPENRNWSRISSLRFIPLI